MAREKPVPLPAHELLLKWSKEADGQPVMPDFDPQFSATYPNLWILMTWKEIDGKGKQPARLTMAVEGTGWTLRLADPTAKRSLVAAAPTLLDALRKLEEWIPHPDCPWQVRGNRNTGWKKLKK